MKTKCLSKKISATSCRLGEGRFAYINVFAPRKKEDGTDGNYGICFLIPKTDTKTIDMIKDCIAAAKEQGKKETWGGKVPANLKLPLRDADEEEREDEGFDGMMFFNANCGKKPGIKVLEGGEMIDALDDDDFYSGCWGCASVRFYPYDSHGNRGIGVGLNNLIKTQDDERLSGGASAEEDFGDLLGN